MADPTAAPAPQPGAEGGAPAPAPAPTTPGADLQVKTEFVLTPSGDPATDLAFKFLASNGVTPGTAAWDAAQKGDFAVVKAALAEKGVQGGAEYVAILEDRASKAVESAKAKQALVQTAVHTAVGGQEAWNTIKAWVADNADDDELAAVNAALKGSPFMAKIMAEGLKLRYERATGTGDSPGVGHARFTEMPASRAPAQAPKALSAAEYQAEAAKLRQTLGFRFDTSPEFAALRARRSAAIAAERR
jgi:hypothetical protein